MGEDRRYTYTVMADCGVGEFIWHRERHHSEGSIGGNLYSLMDVGCEHPEMSADLFEAFCRWARWYMEHDPSNISKPCALDWDAFNAEGMQLAVRLKRELGDVAAVAYAKAHDDPMRSESVCTEIIDISGSEI